MKLATIRHGDTVEAAVVDDETGRVHPLGTDMLSVVRAGGVHALPAAWVALSSVEVLAPIPRPSRNIFCVGKNYHEHAREFARSGFDSSAKDERDAIPTAPIIFSKVPEMRHCARRADPADPSGISEKVDYEAELAVVIGKGGRGISQERRLRPRLRLHDRQRRHRARPAGAATSNGSSASRSTASARWARGWSPPTSVDPQNLSVRCWVNDEMRQEREHSRN